MHKPSDPFKQMPAYARDEGPLRRETLAAIRKLIPQDQPFTVTKSLL